MDSRAAEMEMIIFRSVFLISPSKGGQEARELRFFFTLSMGAPVSAALLNSIIQLTFFFSFFFFFPDLYTQCLDYLFEPRLLLRARIFGGRKE